MGALLYDLADERQTRGQGAPSSFKADGTIGNALSRLGTATSRTAQNVVQRQRIMQRPELATLGKDGLARTIIWELPQDAATPVKVVTDALDPQAINDAFDVLKASARFTRAGAHARWFGGSAVFIDAQDGRPLHEPIDLTSLQRIRQLHVLSRYELVAQYPLDHDLASSNFGLPGLYRYHPTQGSAIITDGERELGPLVHHSRLIRFFGEDVADEERPEYDYWGQPVLEAVWDRLSNLTVAEEAGAELTHQVGLLSLYLENLPSMLAAEGDETTEKWIGTQMLALSSVNALLLGPNDKLTRETLQLSGWADVFDRLILALCAVTRMPQVKLFGTAPSGLTSDDQASARQWSKRVDTYQDDVLRDAYNYLLTLLFASKEGPTKGVTPESWRVEFEPYEVPSEAERAATTDKRADTIGKLLDKKVISVAEARASLDGERGLVLLAEEDAERDAAASPAPGAAGPEGVKAGAESVADTALNGAQSAAAAAIVAQVEAGEMTVRSGMEILKLAFLIDDTRAAALLNVAPGEAPPPGAETLPLPAEATT